MIDRLSVAFESRLEDASFIVDATVAREENALSITRTDLTARLASIVAISIRDADLVLRTMLDEIGAGLAEGSRVELRGFGIFEPKALPARQVRNPRSGEALATPAKTTVHFRAAKAMHQLLNGDGDARSTMQAKRDDAVRRRDEKAGQPSLF